MWLDKLKDIKTVILDVDGVLTSGQTLVNEEGEHHRIFNIKDGYAIQHTVKCGIKIVVISGGKSNGILLRMNALGVKDVFLGSSNKKNIYEDYIDKNKLNPEEILYMGDDIPDYEVMSMVGVACCPNDAAQEIKEVSHYISPKNGGEGACRDVLEKLLKMQNFWMTKESLSW
jgi:3-deoxy-D-manno-octulosonate 8-phosphate phosphatase (KDO 8-P phosphatase)